MYGKMYDYLLKITNFAATMQHLGEIISLVVAVSWTVTAIFADKASHRLGSMTTNVIRLSLASVFLAALLWITVGHPYPVFADGKTWLWLGLSALVGYVFGTGACLTATWSSEPVSASCS